MTGTPLVVLDACVLANFSLCDTLLRCAESPRLFEPKWSDEIILETTRTLESKLNWPSSLAAYFQAELRVHFADAWITDYQSLIPRMTNDEKDRQRARRGRPMPSSDHCDIQPSALQGRAPEFVGCPRVKSSIVPDRDVPSGTGHSYAEVEAAGCRSRPKPG